MPPYIRRLHQYNEHHEIIEQCEQELNEAVASQRKCEREWITAVEEEGIVQEWCACRQYWCHVDCSARRV